MPRSQVELSVERNYQLAHNLFEDGGYLRKDQEVRREDQTASPRPVGRTPPRKGH